MRLLSSRASIGSKWQPWEVGFPAHAYSTADRHQFNYFWGVASSVSAQYLGVIPWQPRKRVKGGKRK